MTTDPSGGSAIVVALAAALPQIANPGKDGKSHHGRYTTLAALLDHTKPVLAEHGLAVLQQVDGDGLRTLFVHTSGEVFDAGTYPLAHYDHPQKQGSALSYARRYGLAAALGVAGADDDGNAASAPAPPPAADRGPNADASRKQIGMIQALFKECGISDREDRLTRASRWVGRTLASSNELTTREASTVIEQLQALRDEDQPQ